MRATVLVADDDENVRVPVAECLQSEGFRVLTAADGAAVVQQLAKTAVDLLILDLHMPVLDGVGVLAAIKGKPHSRDIPVLIMSGRPQDAPPGVAVLGKACGLEQLISTVEHLLSAARPLKATPPAARKHAEACRTHGPSERQSIEEASCRCLIATAARDPLAELKIAESARFRRERF